MPLNMRRLLRLLTKRTSVSPNKSKSVKILIDENAGFCFGVVKAIAAAEEQLSDGSRLYCLGDIVHNNAEVRRLSDRGLDIIDYARFRSLSDAKVLIRAHGEPPETYEMARRQGIRLIDATCPIVLALQKRIREGYEAMRSVDGQVVIFGKPGHAEVIGLNGQTGNTAIIVSRPDDLDRVDFHRPIRLYSQTTKSREEYEQLIAAMGARCKEVGMQDFVAHNTICNRVANRATQLEDFAKGVDLLLFVSGSNSSNGHYLFEYCKKVQPSTHMISDAGELDDQWFSGVNVVGITGATSTPRWLMEQVKERIEQCI